jgi:hypothetical protein
MTDIAKQVHDARRPLNNISMQAELIKMLIEGSDQQQQVHDAANKIIQYCQDCSASLQSIHSAQSNES